MKTISFVAAISAIFLGASPLCAQTMPAWTEGTLDLHFIATGRGDSMFYILPDGTRMLCDAGDIGKAWKIPQPNPSMTPGEWIAKYVKDFSLGLPGSPDELDYFYLTHYHGDHAGTMGASSPGTHGYRICGATAVGEQIHFKKIIDRDVVSHSFPSKEYYEQKAEPFIKNHYFAFCKFQHDSCGTVLEDFKVGSRDQFKLVYEPGKYKKDFEIYNIAANGQIHTGKGKKTRPMYDDDPNTFDENMFSCVILMRYGKFTFYNGGDVCGGYYPAFNSQHRDFESQIADLIGTHVTLVKPDHHGWKDSTNSYFLSKLTPEVFVIMCSQKTHPYGPTLMRMIDPLSYAGPRRVYITNDGSKERVGEELGRKLAELELNQPRGGTEANKRGMELVGKELSDKVADILWSHVEQTYGHIVVRVYPGGNSYQVFVLDSVNPGYRILHQSEIINL